jgi:hypothetical protein
VYGAFVNPHTHQGSLVSQALEMDLAPANQQPSLPVSPVLGLEIKQHERVRIQRPPPHQMVQMAHRYGGQQSIGRQVTIPLPRGLPNRAIVPFSRLPKFVRTIPGGDVSSQWI